METSKCVSCCLTAGLIQTRGRGRYVGGLPATGLTRSHPPTSQARETPMHYAAHADEPEILYMLAWFGGNPDLSKMRCQARGKSNARLELLLGRRELARQV